MKIRVPSWEGLTKIGRSKAVTLTIFVPIIGYMIIFNSELAGWFELSRQIFPHDSIKSNELSSEAVSRLYYFYFGLTFLGVASAVYQLVCPNLIKQHQTDRTFVVGDMELMTDKRMNGTVGYLESHILDSFADELRTIRKRIQSLEYTLGVPNHKKEIITDLMLLLWQHENWSSPISRTVVFILYILGFGVLAVPTIQTFITVVRAFYQHI